MSARDTVVIGAGANGLTTAALLARGGRRVLVVEAHETVGGMAALDEFHPGYRSPGPLYDSACLRPAVVQALELERHGLRLRAAAPPVRACAEQGGGLLIPGDPTRVAETIGADHPADAERWRAWRVLLDRVAPVLRQFLDRPPLDLVDVESNALGDLAARALRLRRLGRKQMLDLLRLPPMCLADWLDEWFDSDALKSALALPALSGSFLGPRSPGSNFNLLLREAAAGAGCEGDGPALVAALDSVAREARVEVRTGCRVERIRVRDGAVRGVDLAGGERIDAACVAASCDPKQTLLRLLEAGAAPYRLIEHLRAFRTRGTTAQLRLALSGLPRWSVAGADVEVTRTGGSLTALERAFDPVKYRELPARPALEARILSGGPGGAAPAGGAVLTALVHFVPHELDGGWDAAARQRLADACVAELERHAPGLESSIAASTLLAPPDLERRYGTTGGHVHHGEHALDQLLVRPAPECSRYRTPVAGLFLCGGGSHPGGGLTCGPGLLAARSMLAG